MMKAWNSAKNVCTICSSLYCYVDNEMSAMGKFRSLAGENYFKEQDGNIEKLMAFMLSNGISQKEAERYFYKLVVSEIGNIIRMAGMLSKESFEDFIKALCSSKMLKVFNGSSSLCLKRSMKERVFWLLTRPKTMFLLKWAGKLFDKQI